MIYKTKQELSYKIGCCRETIDRKIKNGEIKQLEIRGKKFYVIVKEFIIYLLQG